LKDKLTDNKYWENYYKNVHAEKKHIVNVCSYYNDFWNMLFTSSKDSQKTLIEIGGYPGRYLAYLASEYNLRPTCLDFNGDDLQVKKSFEVMGVQDYSILKEDFTSFKTPKKYDYVISNGFIEHFKDFDSIMDMHVTYLSDKGKMLIMIPNMRGYIKFYKYLVDWNNLKTHNLKCMSLNVFKEFSVRNNLKVKYLDYYGGFPLGVHQKLNVFQKLIYKLHRVFFKKIANPYLMEKSSRFFSSSIIAVFEKE